MSDQQPGDPLGVLPARVRQYVYLGYAVLGCLGTGLTAVGAALGSAKVALAGAAVLAGTGALSPLFGGVAASNVRPRRRS